MWKVSKQTIDNGREVMPKAYMYLEWIVANFEKKDVSLAVQYKLVLFVSYITNLVIKWTFVSLSYNYHLLSTYKSLSLFICNLIAHVKRQNIFTVDTYILSYTCLCLLVFKRCKFLSWRKHSKAQTIITRLISVFPLEFLKIINK